MARFGFNTAEYEPDTGSGGAYTPIPEGEYELMCEEAEEKKTSAGTGVYIKAKFQVLGPTNTGRFIFMNFNIQNPSSKAEEIGRRQISGWAAACGRPNAADTEELLNMPFKANVTIEPGQGQYGPQNRISGYKVAQTAPKTTFAAPATKPTLVAAPAPASAPAPAQTAKPAGKKAPWDD
tara:strand:- start:2750 stop:3286 length:537 start_codon:yes stop_codon:yes gene_type:complete